MNDTQTNESEGRFGPLFSEAISNRKEPCKSSSGAGEEAENWKPVTGFVGIYDVSDRGRVRRLSQASPKTRSLVPGRNYDPKILVPVINNGYGYITFVIYNKNRCRKGLHRIVLETFVGPAPDGFYACHRNGDKSNNSLSNLKWASPKENQQDRVDHGRNQCGENNGSAKLTKDKVDLIRKLRDIYKLPYHIIAARVGATKGNVFMICKGKTWNAAASATEETKCLPS